MAHSAGPSGTSRVAHTGPSGTWAIMDPDKDSRGSWGVIVGAAIAGITPAEASLEGNILIVTVPMLAPLEGQA